ncbi:MAG: M48 family metalloprotease [Armatimonadota bacterium]
MRTRQEYAEYVRRLEGFAQRSPGSYRFRLGMLAALGYAYLLALFLTCAGALAGIVIYTVKTGRFQTIEIKLPIGLAVFAWIIARSLWVKLERPTGVEVQPGDAPQLFADIETLRVKLRAPRLAHVLLTDDYGASVVQHPRLGVLGWQENYLLLGAPFMQAVSPEELRAVVAHELGHVSGNHGRFGTWIWRVRSTWESLTATLSQSGHRGAFLVNLFSRWYAPRFMAYSFALVRANEREADRYAAQVTSPQALARALATAAVGGRALGDKVWPELYQRVNVLPSPPADAITSVARAARQPPDPAQADLWLREELAGKTRYDDTHPSLGERIASFGYPGGDAAVRAALLPHPLERTAAEAYLGAALPAYLSRLDGLWAHAIGDAWAQRHAQAVEGREALASLTTKAELEPLTREEAWEQVRLTHEFVSPQASRPLVKAALEQWPDFAPARLTYGQFLLDDGDETGIPLVDEAMARDRDLVLPGCEAVYEFLRRKGRDEEAERYWDLAAERRQELELEERQKTTFTKRDRFLPHGAPQEVVASFRERCQADREVKEAYLVRKEIPSRPEAPIYVLGVVPKFRGHFYDPDKAGARLIERLFGEREPPITVFTIVIQGQQGYLRKKMSRIEGALIYKSTGK